MAVKKNESAWAFNTTKEEGKHTDKEKRSATTNKSARYHSSNTIKGPSRVEKDSSLSTLLTKHNNDTVEGTGKAWEKEDRTDE
eukprot:11042074-Ditylum_brightwellii.AAC.1